MIGLLWGAAGALEVRREGGETRLSGSFPYGRAAVLSDGGRTGRPRKEIIEPRAFGFRVDNPEAEIHLLVGHDFGKPLASKLGGTLTLRDTAESLSFSARISPAVADTSHGRDALALIGAGLAVGLSPGFRLPPERAVKNAETIEEEPNRPEDGMHRAIIRRIKQALLFELSVVTSPAYPDAQVEARNWNPGPALVTAAPMHMRRWRL